jgi:protein gp37
MGKNTGVAWADDTFNPFWGCTKISPACANCYAATFDRRLGGDHWGPKAPRRFFGDKHWNEPLRWNREAEKAGERRRVFCASMADVFEIHADPIVDAQMSDARDRLWRLIAATPLLDWLLLTKRPENIASMVPWNVGFSKEAVHTGSPPARGNLPTPPWSNVWLGTTVENQAYADERIQHLLKVRAIVHFLSCEPLLGPIDLSRWLDEQTRRPVSAIDWVITGCESGAGARPTDVEWYRSLRDQCAETGTDFFLKQAIACNEGWSTTVATGVGVGEWSLTKKISGVEVIDRPYLDGKQHLNFPRPR